MEKDSNEWILAATIDDIQDEIGELLEHLVRAERMVAPARRARVSTLKLTKLFKDFRRLSCEVGLK
jgi:hypothetical protein